VRFENRHKELKRLELTRPITRPDKWDKRITTKRNKKTRNIESRELTKIIEQGIELHNCTTNKRNSIKYTTPLAVQAIESLARKDPTRLITPSTLKRYPGLGRTYILLQHLAERENSDYKTDTKYTIGQTKAIKPSQSTCLTCLATQIECSDCKTIHIPIMKRDIGRICNREKVQEEDIICIQCKVEIMAYHRCDYSQSWMTVQFSRNFLQGHCLSKDFQCISQHLANCNTPVGKKNHWLHEVSKVSSYGTYVVPDTREVKSLSDIMSRKMQCPACTTPSKWCDRCKVPHSPLNHWELSLNKKEHCLGCTNTLKFIGICKFTNNPRITTPPPGLTNIDTVQRTLPYPDKFSQTEIKRAGYYPEIKKKGQDYHPSLDSLLTAHTILPKECKDMTCHHAKLAIQRHIRIDMDIDTIIREAAYIHSYIYNSRLMGIYYYNFQHDRLKNYRILTSLLQSHEYNTLIGF